MACCAWRRRGGGLARRSRRSRLSERGLQRSRQGGRVSVSVEVEVENLRRLARQVVVQRQDLEASRLELAHHAVDLGGEEHEVAHRHRLPAAGGPVKRRPRSERQRRLDRDVPDLHGEIRPGPTEPMDIARQVFPGLPEHVVRLFPAGLLRLETERPARRATADAAIRFMIWPLSWIGPACAGRIRRARRKAGIRAPAAPRRSGRRGRMPERTRSIPRVSGAPELAVLQVDVVDDLGDRAEGRVAQRRAAAKRLEGAPVALVREVRRRPCRKRARPGAGASFEGSRNRSFARGSTNRRMSHAEEIRSTLIPWRVAHVRFERPERPRNGRARTLRGAERADVSPFSSSASTSRRRGASKKSIREISSKRLRARPRRAAGSSLGGCLSGGGLASPNGSPRRAPRNRRPVRRGSARREPGPSASPGTAPRRRGRRLRRRSLPGRSTGNPRGSLPRPGARRPRFSARRPPPS